MNRDIRPKPPSQPEKLDWLRLIRSENVGPITFHRLLERFGTAAAALAALPDLAKKGGARNIKVATTAQAEDEMAAIENAGARLVARGEAEYPPLLAHIEDAPPLLAVIGNGHLLAKKAVAVVGARNASVNGQRFAETLARDLGQGGLLVVSGMARGIDAAAHRGAISTGTVAILGGGVDVVYPKENQALYERLLAEGALVSEAPAGHQPQARDFPRRNRLISGVARGVVVVEASPRSGSLITARMALEQGREVFAVPGAATDPRARGANNLIRQGAILTESADDVLDALKGAGAGLLKEPEGLDIKAVSQAAPAPDALAEARAVIEKSLGPAPSKVDEIIRLCQLSPPVVSWVLLELELAGRLERHPGNQVSLIEGP